MSSALGPRVADDQRDATVVAELPRPRWLVSDAQRGLWSGVLGTLIMGVAVLAAIKMRVVTTRHVDTHLWMWAWVLSIWSVITGIHMVLTWLAFRGLSGAALEAAVMDSPRHSAQQSFLRRTLVTGGDAASYAVQMAGLALFGVVALLVDGRMRSQPVVLIAAGALVVMAWLEVVVNYALHYAREDLRDSFVRLPDEPGERAWSDYVYLAVAVQTTFGVTDATVATARGRRMVTQHALLAFGFNTVLVAMMVSFALGG